MGVTPQEVVETYHNHFKTILPRMGIRFDNYGSTDHPLNHARTREIAQKLLDNGYIYPRNVTLPHCPNCQTPLPDDVRFCPECGTKIAEG